LVDLLTTVIKLYAYNKIWNEKYELSETRGFYFQERNLSKKRREEETFGPVILPEGGVRGQHCISDLGRE
jgi:hypothetical protein